MRVAQAIALVAVGLPLLAADETATPQFEHDVLPILTAHCFKCHGLEARRGDLDLRTPPLIMKGGKSGAVINKGSAASSLLYQKISTAAMPPGNEIKLRNDQTEIIRHWIDGGAPSTRFYGAATRLEARPVTDKDREWWAFRKPVPQQPPKVRQTQRVRTPVDAFILAKLEEKKLSLAPDADRVTLTRRVYFDLLGLPPLPHEVDEFVADKSPDAYEKLIDRLLASPHFGERWGRHWLDAAGYVDTMGGDNDAGTTKFGDGKWRYRDFVVRSFNDDKPYDHFVTEQLAGDELVDWRSAPKFTPEIRELLTATGFLRVTSDDTDENELNTADIRHGIIQRTVQTVTSNLLGVTVACAQCHSHKYDPIPQVDYYRMTAIFTPALNPQAWLQPKDRVLADVSTAEKTELDRENAEVEHEADPLRAELNALHRPYEERLLDEKLTALPAPLREETRLALLTPLKERTPVQKYLEEKLGPLYRVPADQVAAAMSGDERAQAAKLEAQIATIEQKRHPYGKLHAVYDTGDPPPTYLLRRGDYLTPGPGVEPGFLTVLSDATPFDSYTHDAAGKTSGRRLALARWLTTPNTPASGLLARVAVNRMWQHLFGEGIVSTGENFGRSGSLPTHPELLDWLALKFENDGWRVKPLLRILMTSSVYRQASQVPPGKAFTDAERNDPGNQLLSRMRLRRLESEAIRDAILVVSGKLDRTIGGPPLRLDNQPGGMVVVSTKDLPAGASPYRRSLYVLARRNYNHSLLHVFDQPVMATNCTRRSGSAVALQSLTMLNDRFVNDRAQDFAHRIAGEASGDSQIDLAFRIALGRKPNAKESAWSQELLASEAKRGEGEPLAALCQMLLNTSEFLYVE